MKWTCPHCSRDTTIVSINKSDSKQRIDTTQSKHPYVYLRHSAIACPNADCAELTLKVFLDEYDGPYSNSDFVKTISTWQLLPNSIAKPQPNYIPNAIKSDYYEACSILSLSPNASATLSRRCLQGIVRDFWKIPKGNLGNLGAELSFIKSKVDSDIWEGIQAIRSVGDIGAHMEKDINYVVDVEDDEAELLIELIEMLFSEWYVSRHKRQERTGRAKQLSATKLKQKKEAKKASVAADVQSKQPTELTNIQDIDVKLPN